MSVCYAWPCSINNGVVGASGKKGKNGQPGEGGRNGIRGADCARVEPGYCTEQYFYYGNNSIHYGGSTFAEGRASVTRVSTNVENFETFDPKHGSPRMCATENSIKRSPALLWKCCLHCYISIQQI